MYTLQIRHGHLSVVQVFIQFLNLSNEFSFLRLSVTKSHTKSQGEAFAAKVNRLCFYSFQCRLASRIIVSYIKRKQFF